MKTNKRKEKQIAVLLFYVTCLLHDPKLIGLVGPNTDGSWRTQCHRILLGRMTQQLSTHLSPVSLGHAWLMDHASLGPVGQVGMTVGLTAAGSWFLGSGRGCQTQVNNNNNNIIDFTIHIKYMFFQ